MRDQVVGLAVAAVLGAILLVILFGVVSAVGQELVGVGQRGVADLSRLRGVDCAGFYFSVCSTSLPSWKTRASRDPILSLARANGIPATDVYVFDASRQSDRVSANVSGFAGTTRISLNDNLLKRCSLAGIESTMGHEMGHYVLNHQFKGLVFNGVEMVLMFALLNWALNAGLARWGVSWGIRGMTDLAVVPFAALLLTIFSFVLTPVDNTITRTMEYEADLYGINASQQPDGEAEVDLMLGEYRKLDPGPIEEFIFFDHPSGRTRITAAMRWKAEHLPGAPLGPMSSGSELRASSMVAAPSFTLRLYPLSPSEPRAYALGYILAPLSRLIAAARRRPGASNDLWPPRGHGCRPKLATVKRFSRISTGISAGFVPGRSAQRKSFPLRSNSYSITDGLELAFSAT